MGNDARQFAIELDREFGERFEGQIKVITQKVALEALSRVVLKTPVDTGRARGNWNVSINAVNFATTEQVDPTGAQTIAQGSAVITGLPEPEVIWLANGLPYINRLENGWSMQAPAGMVALTVSELEQMFARVE